MRMWQEAGSGRKGNSKSYVGSGSHGSVWLRSLGQFN